MHSQLFLHPDCRQVILPVLCSGTMLFPRIFISNPAALRIRDVYPGSWILIFPARIPEQGKKGTGWRIWICNKEYKFIFFNTKDNYTKLLGNMIRDVFPDPGSQIWNFSILDPGVKKAPDPDP